MWVTGRKCKFIVMICRGGLPCNQGVIMNMDKFMLEKIISISKITEISSL